MAMAMTTDARRIIRVELGARSYDVVVGADLFAEAATRIAARQPRVTRVAIVTLLASTWVKSTRE